MAIVNIDHPFSASGVLGSNGMPIVQFSPVDRQLVVNIANAASENKINKTSLAGLAASSNANQANRRVAQ